MKSETEWVEPLHAPQRVDIYGFDAADDYGHMIEWLRKGKNFRQFVVNDVETELYAQDHGAQLLCVTCTSKPKMETKVKQVSSGKGLVTQFSAMFPISLRVRASEGAIWNLDVQHGYVATNLDQTESFRLRLDFTIMSHRVEA